MSLWDTRGNYCVLSGPDQKPISDKELLEKTLAAVKGRRGLIHGDLRGKHGTVCALGALVMKYGEVTVPPLAEDIQKYNDSMPSVSKETRRARVIKWLEKRLASLA